MELETQNGSPSAGLARAMQPELKVSRVAWRGAGPCAHAPPATRAPDTYPPITRNQVDHLTATVGHLLVYKVPEVLRTTFLTYKLYYKIKLYVSYNLVEAKITIICC